MDKQTVVVVGENSLPVLFFFLGPVAVAVVTMAPRARERMWRLTSTYKFLIIIVCHKCLNFFVQVHM